ncbi:MAG: POTRA domain-containing protein [Bacteroidia bacterium]
MKQWLSYLLLIAACFSYHSAYGQANPKYFLRHIYIEGNKVTKPEVILREITLHEGDSLYKYLLKNALAQSQIQLLNTSLFNSASVKDSFVDENTIDIYVNVTERWYLVPSFEFALADRNFNEWWQDKQLYRTTFGFGLTHYNFRGRNQRLGAEVVLGWRESLLLRYKIPYLNKKKTLGLSTVAFYQRGHEVGFITLNNQLQFLRVNDRHIFRKTGFESALNYRRQHKFNHVFRFALENYTIDDSLAKNRNIDFLGDGKNNIILPRFSYQFIFDDRNNIFYPISGHYFSAFLEQKGLGDKSSGINIITADFIFRKFFSFTNRLSLASNIKAQISRPDTLPYIFRSSLGYRYQIRGYEHFVMDGNAYFLIANELRYKAWQHTFKLKYLPFEQFNTIPLAVYAKIFYDKGYVSYPLITGGNNLLNQWLDGFGAGLDITSYYDKILRLEYSFNNLQQSELFLHYLEVF